MRLDDDVPVTTHDDFTAKHMPDIGHDVADSKVFTWRLTNWKKLGTKVVSPVFNCGGYRWRLLLHPSGNLVAPPYDTVSLFLDCLGSQTSIEEWHACTEFALVISNPNYPSIYRVGIAHYRFVSDEPDWGFTRFSDHEHFFSVHAGHSRPLIEDQCVNVTVFVRVLEDTTGFLWHSLDNYDSKKETGYVGVRNDNKTFPTNSILQSLFCINYFRKAVYHIPTDDDHPTESVALALQRVFYHLQTSEKSVGSMGFSRDVPWKPLSWLFLPDISGLERELESKIKDTRVEGTLAKLFVGRMKQDIKCINIDYEYSNTEEFMCLQLSVKGMKNLYHSFKRYVATETFNGEKKYDVEGHGLQDITRTVTFESFPPVLHIQLRRQEYDTERMTWASDRFEFPLEIDLDEFLHPSADRSQPWIYKLYSVIAQTRSRDGEYFALVKPAREAPWLKFDQSFVIPTTEKEDLEGCCGGRVISYDQSTALHNQFHDSLAHMLVYIRESAIDGVLAPLEEEDTPAHLKHRFEKEVLQGMEKKKERDEQRRFLTVKVVTDELFSKYIGFDLAVFGEKNWLASDLPTFRIAKREPYCTLENQVVRHFSCRRDTFRLWALVDRKNKSVRPEAPISENDLHNIGYICRKMTGRHRVLRLYLDMIPDPYEPDPPSRSVMIFLKHFDISKQTMYGMGKIYMLQDAKISDLIPIINERMGWGPELALDLYEEINPGRIERKGLELSLSEAEVQDGDIICFQVNLSETEICDLEARGFYSNPVQYYEFLQNRVKVIFKPKSRSESHDYPEFSVILSMKDSYEMLVTKAGEVLQYDAMKLRLTATDPTYGLPTSVLKITPDHTIHELAKPNHHDDPSIDILYEKMDVVVADLEIKCSLTVTWISNQNEEKEKHSFFLPKNTTICELADHLSKLVMLTLSGTHRIRVFEMSKDRRMQKEFTETHMIGQIPDPVELYAEEIPIAEMEANSNSDKVISVFHFSKKLSRTHGIPFKFVVKRGEKFVDTKRRLRERIKVSDCEFAGYRFALIQASRFEQCLYIEDEDIIYERHFAPGDLLGLDHTGEP